MKPKLVRDLIPGIIIRNGETPVIRKVKGKEFDDALANKLVEEAIEFLKSGKPEELVDVLEVILTILRRAGMDMDQLEYLRQRKEDERGGLYLGLILEKVLQKNGS